jgi:DNA topoisomerase-1
MKEGFLKKKIFLQTMTSKEKDLIDDLQKCNFKQMAEYFKLKSEERKNRSKDEKKVEFIVLYM